MKILSLSVPDWSQLSSELGIAKPYWQWTVVDQPLIDHWIDYARDNGYQRMRLYAGGDTQAIEAYLAKAFLFDCAWEVVDPTAGVEPDSSAARLSDLPGFARLSSEPVTSWELVDHHRQLERTRLGQLWNPELLSPPSVCLGRFARLNVSAQIEGPVWIGDNTRIGRGVHLGPFTVIGANCVVSEGASLRNTSVGEGTILGSFTQFDGHLVLGDNVLNRGERIRLGSVDAAIARSTRGGQWGRRIRSIAQRTVSPEKFTIQQGEKPVNTAGQSAEDGRCEII